MLDYTSPKLEPSKSINILKLGRGTEATITLSCESGVYVETHFHERSIICPGTDDCDLCIQGFKRQGTLFVIGVVNERTLLCRVPSDFPTKHIQPGQQLFLKRARRNNQLFYQLGLFTVGVNVTHSDSEIWHHVLSIHRVDHPIPLEVSNPLHSRTVKENIQAVCREAAIRAV